MVSGKLRGGLAAFVLVSWLLSSGGSRCLAQAPERATVTVDAGNTLRTFDRRMLLGSNVAVWNEAGCYASSEVREWLADLGPGIMRMPGGSYSDIVFWNGNGVRGADGRVDPTRVRDGFPLVDYGGYAPSFLWDAERRAPNAQWSGHVDVKTQHEFVKAIPGCETLVTVNAGTGRALDAAEWVRWANKAQGYGVRYWEIGNELEGSWEAGHFLPDGGELTAEMYAARFREFAQAMKAVDPTIKIGGAAGGSDKGGYTEVLLRDAGEDVDFVSFHTYPCQPGQSEEEMLARARTLGEPLETIRGWLREHQPERAESIPIAVTEWNLPTTRVSSDLFGALWSCIFVGEMVRNGVDFANQWDMFTQGAGEEGGFALLIPGEPPTRKSQYWAFWLWRHYMGDALVASEVEEAGGDLYALATRVEDALYVMLVNTSRERELAASVEVAGFRPAAEGETALLSRREYFWNPLSRKAEWNRGPRVAPVKVGSAFEVSVPPFSVRFVRVPDAASAELSKLAEEGRREMAEQPGEPELRIVLPSEEYADTAAEGWVRAFAAGTDRPYPRALPPATLEVTGPAEADRGSVRLTEAAGRFFLEPTGAGAATVKATVGDLTAAATIAFRPSVPRPYVFWEFGEGSLGKEKGVESAWPLSLDASARANRTVARVDLPGVVPDREHQAALLLSSLPRGARLKRENIRGVFFDLLVSRDFACDDPNASLEVVMQSQADYWMSLGSLPLVGRAAEWATHTFPVTREEHIRAMPEAFNIWLVLRANRPVHGTLYVDRVGLLVR